MSLNQQPVLARIGQLSPLFQQLTEEVLFDRIWQDDTLTARERSLITVAALTALNRTEQLPVHIQNARNNGLTVDELSAVITHLAFYAGWPAAVSAFTRLADNAAEENGCH